MEPITINLPDLGQWMPYGWLAAYSLVAVSLGVFSRRHIRLFGIMKGDVQSSHGITAVLSGAIGVIVFIATLCSANDLFDRSIFLADKNVKVNEQAALLEERMFDLRQDRQDFFDLRQDRQDFFDLRQEQQAFFDQKCECSEQVAWATERQ